jgi:hypothetical protein
MIGVFPCNSIDNVHFDGITTRFQTQIIACCADRCSYLLFSYPPHFDRGLKVRLFNSPQCFPRGEHQLFTIIIVSKKTQHISRLQISEITPIFYTHYLVTNFMLPKRRFWKAEQKMTSGCSKHFSTFRCPNPVLTPLKSASKKLIEMFVRPSKIFVWGA